MLFIIGVIFTVQGHYTTRQFGAAGYVAIFPGYAGLRTCAPEMWGWILSAKVGCGFVAELGSMRANEEIDALEVIGVDPVSYLVSTRVLASILVMPFLFIVGLGALYGGAYLMGTEVLQSVSPGGFLQVLWAFQSPLDLLFSMIWTMTLGVLVVLVGCYYGFHAEGGPVGVGRFTARSMVVNMVLVSLVGLFFQQLFWAGFPNAPVAN
jgi:phospholipid/cholesterol/gamma-HCH transport system permease protein